MRESRGGTGRVVKVGVMCFLVSTYLLLAVIKAVEEVVIRNESHCSNKCGDVTIPYPFGIEDGCYYRYDHDQRLLQKLQKKSYFQIYCNRSSSPHTPIFGRNLEVTSISVEDGEFLFKNDVAYQCFSNFTQTGIDNNVTHFHWNSNQHSINLGLFTLSRSKNALVVMGCDTEVLPTVGGIVWRLEYCPPKPGYPIQLRKDILDRKPPSARRVVKVPAKSRRLPVFLLAAQAWTDSEGTRNPSGFNYEQ